MMWSSCGSAGGPSGRWGHTATRVTSNHVLVTGGIAGGKIFNDISVYDIGSERWMTPHTSGTGITGRWGHSATLVPAGCGAAERDQLIIFGGREGSKPMPFTEMYTLDLTTFEWRKQDLKPPAPRNRYAHSALLVPELGQIVVFGGHGGRTRYFKDIHMFDTHMLKWTAPVTSGTGPSKRSGQAMTRAGNNLLVFGGFNGTAILADMFSFNLTTYSWAAVELTGVTRLPAMYGHSMNAVPNSTMVVIFGGCYSASKLSSRTYVVDVRENKVSPISVEKSPPSRFWHRTVVSSTSLLIFGGSGSSNNALTDVHKLDLKPVSLAAPGSALSVEGTSLDGDLSPTHTINMAIGMGGMGNLAQARASKQKKKANRAKQAMQAAGGGGGSTRSRGSRDRTGGGSTGPPPGLTGDRPGSMHSVMSSPHHAGVGMRMAPGGAGMGAGAGSRPAMLHAGASPYGGHPVPHGGMAGMYMGHMDSPRGIGVHGADAGAGAVGGYHAARAAPPPMPPVAMAEGLRVQQAYIDLQRQHLGLQSAVVSALQELNKASIVAPSAHLANAQAILRSAVQL